MYNAHYLAKEFDSKVNILMEKIITKYGNVKTREKIELLLTRLRDKKKNEQLGETTYILFDYLDYKFNHISIFLEREERNNRLANNLPLSPTPTPDGKEPFIDIIVKEIALQDNIITVKLCNEGSKNFIKDKIPSSFLYYNPTRKITWFTIDDFGGLLKPGECFTHYSDKTPYDVGIYKNGTHQLTVRTNTSSEDINKNNNYDISFPLSVNNIETNDNNQNLEGIQIRELTVTIDGEEQDVNEIIEVALNQEIDFFIEYENHGATIANSRLGGILSINGDKDTYRIDKTLDDRESNYKCTSPFIGESRCYNTLTRRFTGTTRGIDPINNTYTVMLGMTFRDYVHPKPSRNFTQNIIFAITE